MQGLSSNYIQLCSEKGTSLQIFVKCCACERATWITITKISTDTDSVAQS